MATNELQNVKIDTITLTRGNILLNTSILFILLFFFHLSIFSLLIPFPIKEIN